MKLNRDTELAINTRTIFRCTNGRNEFLGIKGYVNFNNHERGIIHKNSFKNFHELIEKHYNFPYGFSHITFVSTINPDSIIVYRKIVLFTNKKNEGKFESMERYHFKMEEIK